VARTPLEVNLKLQKNYSKELPDVPYQRLIGSLMYVAVCTRPDVAYAVNYLSQFNTCYSIAHWNCAKRVLRYLKGTCDERLTFRKTNKDLIGLTDANWAGDSTDRRSYNGFVFILAGGAISWGSQNQKCVALSSTESEYIALSEGARESVYLTDLLSELTAEKKTVQLYLDNQSAIKLCYNPVFHNRTKHIDIRYHYT
jgi:hypothetical protein